jgi:maltose O-acetyltransferase
MKLVPTSVHTIWFFAKRHFWYCFYYGFAQHLPSSYRFQPFGRLGKLCRRIACRRLFRAAGERINVEHGADFFTGWEIELGDDSSLGVHCRLPFDLKVGKDVMMGPDVVIVGENHRFENLELPMRLQGYTRYPPVRIQDDAWIGARVVILPGIQIGRGAIVGSGAVVTRDVPDFAICAGNPARILRYRKHADMASAKDRNAVPNKEICPTNLQEHSDDFSKSPASKS